MLKKEFAILLILALVCLGGCGDKAEYQSETLQMSHSEDDGHDHGGEAPVPSGLQGTILETMDSGGYTYVRLETADGEVWAAGPKSEVEVGQKVVMPGQMLMRGFASKTLDKTFDEIWFVSEIQQLGQAGVAAPAKMGSLSGAAAKNMTVAPSTEDFSDIGPVEGGMTIAEIFAAKGRLNGQSITLKAKVVKYSANIMSRNWIHVQDGTSLGDHFDLTVTSSATAKVGDIVVIRGTMAEDKDFGAGYLYEMIVENAEISVQ